MVANFHICDALANGFNDTTSFVSADDRECAFWVFPGEGICIRVTDLIV
jgi:hypothetical protein